MDYTQAVGALTTWMSSTRWFPFTEGANCDITGPGHQDPHVFVRHIQEYDSYLSGDENMGEMDTAHVKHVWLRIDEEGEEFSLAEPFSEGSVPATILWGVR